MSELTKALVKARIACNAVVHKSGKNMAQNYSYVGHEQVLVSGAREALLVNGLVLVETAVMFVGELKYATRNGEQLCWAWRGEFMLMHESGESQRFDFSATTGPNDKAAFVASTALDRTAMLRICHLAGGAKEDPEHDSNERFEEAVKRPARVASTAEKLDRIARGGEPAERPLPNDSAGSTMIPTSRGGDPARVGGVASAVVSDVAQTGNTAEVAAARGGERAVSRPTADRPRAATADASGAPHAASTDGELLDAAAWRARYEAVCDEAMQAGFPFVGEDERGLPIPKPETCPAFSSKAKKYAGKRYDEAPAGFLREAMASRPDFDQGSLAGRLWILRCVAQHKLGKAGDL